MIIMPIHKEEETFVKQFIVEYKQERYLFFLSKPATRGKFLNELYHNLAIKENWAAELASRELDPTPVAHRLRAYGAGSQAYVISPNDKLDGKWLELEEVLLEIIENDSAAILCCVTGKLAFYQSEDSAYILHYKRPQK